MVHSSPSLIHQIVSITLKTHSEYFDTVNYRAPLFNLHCAKHITLPLAKDFNSQFAINAIFKISDLLSSHSVVLTELCHGVLYGQSA